MKTVTFQIHDEHAPAFRSFVEEMCNEIGGRLEGSHKFVKETALTAAAITANALRTAVTAVVPKGDPHYA